MMDGKFVRGTPKSVQPFVDAQKVADQQKALAAPPQPGVEAVQPGVHDLLAAELFLQVKGKELNRKEDKAPPGSRFARVGPDGKPRVSPSQVHLMLSCGERFRRKYLVGDPDPPSVDMLFGTVFHAIMEAGLRGWLKTKAAGKAAYPPSSLLSEASHVLTLRIFQDTQLLARLRDGATADPVALAAKMREVVPLMWDWVQEEQVEPISVEDSCYITLNVNGEEVGDLGFRDAYVYMRKRDRYATVDWKTVGTSPTSIKGPPIDEHGGKPVILGYVAKRQHNLSALQYTQAAMEKGERVDDIVIAYAVLTKTAKVCIATLAVTPAMLAWHRKVTKDVIGLIQGGHFVANPTSLLCSVKMCAYWATCPSSAMSLEGDAAEE